MKSIIKKMSILGIAIIIMFSNTEINLASTVPTPSGRDITSSVNVSTDLFSYYDTTQGKEVIVIEDNEVILNDITVKYKEEIKLNYSWRIDDSVDAVQEGDYFKIPLPKYFTINFYGEGNGFIPIYNEVDDALIGYWRVVSNNVEGVVENYIEFIAHSNFAAVIADRNGYFNLRGFISQTQSNSEEVILRFPGIDIDTTITNSEYVPPRHEQEGFGSLAAKPSQMPNIEKNAAGKISPGSDNTGTGLWAVRFGYDDYLNTSYLRQGGTYEGHKNVVIRDEIEQEGHIFTTMSIRLPYFTPYNAEGVTSAYWKASWTPSMEALGIERYYETDYKSVQEWEEAVSAPENAPAYGISDDGKIAILNLGNILDNGIKYAPDNASLEQMLRKDKLLTNDEVKAIMQSIGENTPSYTLTEYDGTEETIAIESFIDNRAICYMVNFHGKMDMVPGREYSNEVAVSYDGITEKITSNNRFQMVASEGGASGTYTGILYLYKYDENGYGTSEEEEITGTQFDLYKINGEREEFISSKITDNVGSVLFEDMTVGKYRIYEKSSEGDYITNSLKLYKRQDNGSHVLYESDELGDNWFEIEVTEEDRYFYFEGTNRKSNGTEFSIIKEDSNDSSVRLLGASFELSDGENVYSSQYDETENIYNFPILPLGKYTLKETVTPLGYEEGSLAGASDIDPDMEGIQIIISDDNPITLTLTNEMISVNPSDPGEEGEGEGEEGGENLSGTVTEDKKEDSNGDGIPGTGDSSSMMIFLLAMLVSIFGLYNLLYKKNKEMK